jgi:hypothetical protein
MHKLHDPNWQNRRVRFGIPLAMLGLAFGLFEGNTAMSQSLNQNPNQNPNQNIPQKANNEWVLAGSSTLRFLGMRIYEAKLRVAPSFKSSSYHQHALELTLEYARTLEGRLIAERSLVEMKQLAPIEAEKGKRWLAFMQTAFPNVRAGDRITGHHDGKGRVAFSCNGQTNGELDDPEFAHLFFGIWLDPKTSQPEMRRALLGSF